MPIDDNSRIGPNQDINDPSLLIEVGYEFNKTSQEIGNVIARINSDNVNQSGTKIIDIIIPLKMSNGTTTDFNCETIISTNEYDKELWKSSVINTYIDLAEKFRDYWNTLNNSLNFPTPFISGIDSHESGISPSIIFETGTSSPDYNLSLTTRFDDIAHYYTSNLFLVQPSTPREEPIWSGYGPVNYNSGTYPQLLQAGGGTNFFEEDSNIRPTVFILSSGNFLDVDNFVRQEYQKYGQGKFFNSNSFIGTERHDSPELILQTTLGRPRFNLSSTITFPSSDDFIIFNISNDDMAIVFNLSASSAVSASRIDTEGAQAPQVFVGGTAFLTSTSIQIRGTGILSTADITTWPPIYTNFDSDSSLINTNPFDVNLNSIINDHFLLPPKIKCVLRISSFCSLIGVDAPIEDAASFTHLINSIYSFEGMVITNVHFGANDFSLSLNRTITN